MLNRYRLRMAVYCLEAGVELAFAKLFVVVLPSKYWHRFLGKFHCESLRTPRVEQRRKFIHLRRALLKTSKYTPWKSKCLDQAIAAQRMLRRRQFSSTLYLGMKKMGETQWSAHAWLRCGDHWVVGYQPTFTHTVVGTYALIKKELR